MKLFSSLLYFMGLVGSLFLFLHFVIFQNVTRNQRRSQVTSIPVTPSKNFSYPTKECRQLVPECIPKTDLLKEYGTDFPHVNAYNQLKCCNSHPLNRAGVVFAMKYFGEQLGIPIQMEGGSLIGLLRHHGMQIPWTGDGDLLMVIDEVPGFTSDNYKQVMLSANTYKNKTQIEKTGGHDFLIVMREDSWMNGMWFRLFVDKKSTGMHHYLDIFIWKKYSPSNQVEPSIMSVTAFTIELPYKMILPGKDCTFYNITLKHGCANDANGYISYVYGKHALIGPSLLDSAHDHFVVMKHFRKKYPRLVDSVTRDVLMKSMVFNNETLYSHYKKKIFHNLELYMYNWQS